jgi:molybdenum cofactor cytidylyltransferase
MIVHSLETLKRAGLDPVVVVTNGAPELAEAIAGHAAMVEAAVGSEAPMLASVQLGLRALQRTPAEAAFILPGDMPLVRAETIGGLLEALSPDAVRIVAPSYARRRGHPIGLARAAWGDVLALRPPDTLRDYLRDHSREIAYVVVEDPGVLQDVDRPEDYERAVGRAAGD